MFSCRSHEQYQKIKFVQDFSELGEYFDSPVDTYSSGMTARLAFGMSMAFDFDFYVVDENLGVGDISFKEKSLAVFNEKSHNKGMIIVSHEPSIIQEYCNQAIYLRDGKLIHSFDIDEIILLYQDMKQDRIG